MSAARPRISADQRLILWLIAVMAALIVGVTVLAPPQDEVDTTPRSTNADPLGTKAIYLTLQALGHKTSRWNNSLANLNDTLTDAQAANTTLVLLEPVYDATEEAGLKAQLSRFLARGGQLLITGHYGARLLGGDTDTAEFLQALCKTQPHGLSSLARAGNVEISNHGGWKLDSKTPTVDVAQKCGSNAVVVSFAVGQGRAVWWTAETPLVNTELNHDPALKLILASLDGDQYSANHTPRDIVFDEAMHTVARTKWSVTHGLPILSISLQLAALCALLLFTFSRRSGPVRMPVSLPRSSPVEFATSMGDLYERGEATSAVTEAARRRLLHALTHDIGLSHHAILAGPEAVEAALVQRLGAAHAALASAVAEHLREANEAAHAKLSAGSTLQLAQALCKDAERLRQATAPAAIRSPLQLDQTN